MPEDSGNGNGNGNGNGRYHTLCESILPRLHNANPSPSACNDKFKIAIRMNVFGRYRLLRQNLRMNAITFENLTKIGEN